MILDIISELIEQFSFDMGQDDMGEMGDVKKSLPPSYDDVVEMTNVVKVKEAVHDGDSNKKGDNGKDEKEKKDGENKPADPEDPPVGVFELVTFYT